jgi:hypothetical protein
VTTRFPAVEAYLAGLPDGLDSHPECQSKASLYRTLIDTRPLDRDDIEALPAPLRQLTVHPMPISSWIPEVHSHALILATYDRRFDSREEFLAHAYDEQKRLFSSRVYAIAFRVLSPVFLLKSMDLRWRMFHRGSRMRLVERRGTHAVVELTHPPGLYDEVSRCGLCEGLRAALDIVAGDGTSVTVELAEPTRAVISARW